MKRLIFFGDSICTGQGISVHRSWVVRLSNKIEQHHPQWTVINAARNGDTTRLALERMPYEVQSHEPAVVAVQFGLNDANYWDSDNGLPRVSLPAFKANLGEIASRAYRAGAQIVVMNTNHLPFRTRTVFPAEVAEYNEAIREVSDGTPGVHLVDIERAIGVRRRQMLMADGVHLNAEGHNLYFSTIAPLLLPLLKEIDDVDARIARTS